MVYGKRGHLFYGLMEIFTEVHETINSVPEKINLWPNGSLTLLWFCVSEYWICPTSNV